MQFELFNFLSCVITLKFYNIYDLTFFSRDVYFSYTLAISHQLGCFITRFLLLLLTKLVFLSHNVPGPWIRYFALPFSWWKKSSHCNILLRYASVCCNACSRLHVRCNGLTALPGFNVRDVFQKQHVMIASFPPQPCPLTSIPKLKTTQPFTPKWNSGCCRWCQWWTHSRKSPS